MSPLLWILGGLGAWTALAVPVALLTGRVLRGLDDGGCTDDGCTDDGCTDDGCTDGGCLDDGCTDDPRREPVTANRR